jgi:ring-1,2-phenylacetyl-CoA epoxidase subunit PaaC
MSALVNYYLEIADNAFILSHRLSENSSKGPFLEEDLACTNVALDLIGMAESIYNEAALKLGGNLTGDDLAYRRSEWEYKNVLLVEQPNTDFAHIMVRQFLMDVYHYYLLTELTKSKDEFLSAVSSKSLKEVTYHLRRSAEWMIRFGNGTEESAQRGTRALHNLCRYTLELFMPSSDDLELREAGISADLEVVHKEWRHKVSEVFYLANLKRPENSFSLSGGKIGKHSEHMGLILSEMQFLTNKYPEAKW